MISCSHSLLTQEYVEWNRDEENGLYKTIEQDGYSFQLQYRPQEFVAISNSSDPLSIDPNAFYEELEELKKYQFFTLRLSSSAHPDFLKANLSSQEEYYQRVAYYSSFAQNDFKLVEEEDTLQCVMYHFERNYGIQPFQTLLLGFKNPGEAPDKDKTLIYQDRILGLEPVSITIQSKNLKHIPQLRL